MPEVVNRQTRASGDVMGVQCTCTVHVGDVGAPEMHCV